VSRVVCCDSHTSKCIIINCSASAALNSWEQTSAAWWRLQTCYLCCTIAFRLPVPHEHNRVSELSQLLHVA